MGGRVQDVGGALRGVGRHIFGGAATGTEPGGRDWTMRVEVCDGEPEIGV